MAQTIGFIGLGNMGGPMAANLVGPGTPCAASIWCRLRCDAARDAGDRGRGLGRWRLSRDAETVITMLPAGRHVVEVWTQLAAALPAGTLMIDSSTIDVDERPQGPRLGGGSGLPLGGRARSRAGPAGAKAGTLTFMAGGGEAAFARAEPMLKAMGKNVFHCGAAGAGQAAKICNNMILGISMIAVSEAFALGEKLGLSHQALFDVASVSSGQCWSLTTYCPVPGPVPTSRPTPATSRDSPPR